MGFDRIQSLISALILTLPAVSSAAAQEAGWYFSPLPGEGDRATLGCALNSTTAVFACVAVRCQDDFSTGVFIHTSQPGGDAGRWDITIDKQTRAFSAVASHPYGGQLIGDYAWVLDNLRHGAVAYLQPTDDSPMPAHHISLDGSLYAINRALAWCAPRVRENEPIAPAELVTDQGNMETHYGPTPARTQ
ncbi:MAG: hypothetical protein MO852_12570 [Candidatus Devosia euplotis]|nr:hypothetical protein [Candidatus Devosia euplotis]